MGRAKRMSPNVVYVGDPTRLGERVVACGTGPSAVCVVEKDGQLSAVPYAEVRAAV